MDFLKISFIKLLFDKWKNHKRNKYIKTILLKKKKSKILFIIFGIYIIENILETLCLKKAKMQL